VGVMLWEAATGTKLWEGVADPTVVHRVLNGQIPTPREIKPDVPEELERIVMKSLSHDREARYATAADLQADLEDFTKHKLPSQREVGALVLDMFAEQRRKMRTLIEGQIASLAAKKASDDTDSGLRMPTGSFLPTAYTNTLSEPPPRPAAPTAPPRARRSYGAWLSVVALVSVTGLLFAWRLQRETTATEVGRSAATGEVTAPVARPAMAEPVTSTVEKAAREHEVPSPAVVVEGPGDDALDDALDDEASASRARHDAKRRRASDMRKARVRSDALEATEQVEEVVSDAPTSPKPAQADECDVPYFVDASGIRRIKRECLSQAE
jgi:hypothetical protein